MKTGPNWKNALFLFFFSLFLVMPELFRSIYCPFPLNKCWFVSKISWITLLYIHNIHFKLAPFYQLYVCSIKNIHHNKLSWNLSPVPISVTPSIFTTICPLLGLKATIFRTRKLNGIVVVVEYNLHKVNKCHSESKSDGFLALL